MYNLDEVESRWCADWVEHGGHSCQISCRISWGIMGAEHGGCDFIIVLCVSRHSALWPTQLSPVSSSMSDTHKHTPFSSAGLNQQVVRPVCVSDTYTQTHATRVHILKAGTLLTHSQGHMPRLADTLQLVMWCCMWRHIRYAHSRTQKVHKVRTNVW